MAIQERFGSKGQKPNKLQKAAVVTAFRLFGFAASIAGLSLPYFSAKASAYNNEFQTKTNFANTTRMVKSENYRRQNNDPIPIEVQVQSKYSQVGNVFPIYKQGISFLEGQKIELFELAGYDGNVYPVAVLIEPEPYKGTPLVVDSKLITDQTKVWNLYDQNLDFKFKIVQGLIEIVSISETDQINPYIKDSLITSHH